MNALPLAMVMTYASCVAPSPVRSGEARYVDKVRHRIQASLQESRSVGMQAVFDDLAALAHEAPIPNWNGYGAAAINARSLRQAEMFLRCFGVGASHPSLGASNEGWVTMQWGRSARWTLSLLITDDGWIHWAALFGSERRSGTVPFAGAIQSNLLALINQAANP